MLKSLSLMQKLMPRQALLLHLNTSSFLPAPSWLQKIRSKQCAAPCCTRVFHYMPCTTLWPQTWTNVRCSAPVCERLSVICFFSRARWLLLRKCLRVQSPRKKPSPHPPPPTNPWNPMSPCMLEPGTLLPSSSLAKPQVLLFETASYEYNTAVPTA